MTLLPHPNPGSTGSTGTPSYPPSIPIEQQNVAQNRISRFTYTAGDTDTTRESELVLLTTGPKFNAIHSAGWLGFKPSDYSNPVSEMSTLRETKTKENL